MKTDIMDLNMFLLVLAALTTLAQPQGYRYSYSRRRASRPASRLFGTNRQTSSKRSRYDPRRPASRRFTIPGFESVFGSSTSSSALSSKNFQNNLGGFNLGLGGPAFADPIAGLYDVQDGGGGLGQGRLVGVNEFASLNPAANTRASLSRESNTAIDPSVFNSRQQQQQQQSTLGTHDSFLGSGGLGFQNINLGFTGNQDAAQYLTASAGNGRGFTTLDLSSGAGNQQLGINNLRSQLGGANHNPLGLGSFQFIDASGMGNEAMSVDLTSLGSPGLQASLNGFDMPSVSGIVETNNLHELVSGHNKGLQNQVGITSHLGLDANQLGLGLDEAQLGLNSKQMGLGQNNILLDSNSLSNSLGLDGNHLIIQSEQMDMANMGQSQLAAGNQILLDTSGGDMSILGNQIGLGNGQALINSNQIGGDLSQLTGAINTASSMQGQMIGMANGEGGTTNIITATGDFPTNTLTSQTLTSQVGLGSTNQFFSPKEGEQFMGQSQTADQATSQLKGGLLTQLTGA